MGIGEWFLILALLFFIFIFWGGMWKLYVKAHQPGWAALIPIYNVFISTKIAKVTPWIMLLMLIPVVNIFAYGYLWFNISKNFGKSDLFSFGLILFPFIFIPIIGYSDSLYLSSFAD